MKFNIKAKKNKSLKNCIKIANKLIVFEISTWNKKFNFHGSQLFKLTEIFSVWSTDFWMAVHWPLIKSEIGESENRRMETGVWLIAQPLSKQWRSRNKENPPSTWFN